MSLSVCAWLEPAHKPGDPVCGKSAFYFHPAYGELCHVHAANLFNRAKATGRPSKVRKLKPKTDTNK